MIEYNLIEDVTKGSLLSAYVEAPFDKGKKLLESRDYKVSSLEENARLRIQECLKSFVSRNGNWVLEDAIYVPNKGIFLTKNSPIMDNTEKAVEEQSNERDFYLEDVEKYLDGAVELDNKPISTNSFGENEITLLAFGKYTEDYGKFLKENKINKMYIYLANMQDKPFARKLWFWGLVIGSGLGCGVRRLFEADRVRGVKINN